MSEISNKDLISKFKDYADIADASYAMLHWINDNEQLQVISLSLMFYVSYTKFGFFGDEGRGFSLSRKDVKTLPGNNKIYIEDLERK